MTNEEARVACFQIPLLTTADAGEIACQVLMRTQGLRRNTPPSLQKGQRRADRSP
jgi:hypothetical protein